MYGFLINQKHDKVFREAGIGVTLNVVNFNYKLYVKKYVPDITLHDITRVNKPDLTIGGILVDVSLMYAPFWNHLLMSVGEESREPNLGNQDVDKNVSNFLFDMLTKSQRLKENDDHIHEDVQVDFYKGDIVVVNTHDHVETLGENLICKDERLIMVCASINNVYGLFYKGAQFIDDVTPHKIMKILISVVWLWSNLLVTNQVTLC